MTARLVTIKDKFKAFWNRIVNLQFSPCLRKVADDALDGNASEQNLSAFQRPESWGLTAGVYYAPAIFDGERAFNKRKGVRVVHNPQYTQTR